MKKQKTYINTKTSQLQAAADCKDNSLYLQDYGEDGKW